MARSGVGWAVLGVAVAGLAAPASALAAQRYASPSGSGSACSQPSPCSLVTAVNGASAFDEVIVAGDHGPYGTPSPIATTLKDAGSVKLHGAAGQPMPVVYSKAFPLAIEFNAGGTISDLDVEELNTSATTVLFSAGADHLVARGGNAGCAPTPQAVLIDSLCQGSTDGIGVSSSGAGTLTMTFRNVTAIASTSGAAINVAASAFHQVVNATNVIARGAGSDLATFAFSGGSLTFNLDHSNYANALPGAGTTITAAGTGTNQTAAPLFVNAAGGDYHQAAGSPTIDQGLDSPLNGLTDWEGKPRLLGAHTDIGADEYAPPSVPVDQTSTTAGGVTTTPITPVLPTRATISGLAETNATFVVGPASTPLTGSTSRRHKRGTVFSFRLDQPATVKLAIQSRKAGRRVGRSCRPDSRRLRRRPRCTRTVIIATLTRTAHAGLNKVVFSGRIGGHPLKPGRYQAVFTATNAAGASLPSALSFTIVRR